MNDDVLIALVGGDELGRVERQRTTRRLRFVYDDGWRTARSAFPLSISLPLAAAEHAHGPVEAFLWNLLPDDDAVQERWAGSFEVATHDAFALLAHVGEDCAGAARLVNPDRAAAIARGPDVQVEWLDQRELARRLRTLRADRSASRAPADAGRFTLAGAQAKTAFHCDDHRVGVPAGRTATTHIFKPPIAGLEGACENEHFCLSLARTLGLPTASSRVLRVEDETALVIERYDRARVADVPGVTRLHQEDLCQAFGLLPTRKYQRDGGPTPERVVELLRARSSRRDRDVATFVDALAFHWLIGSVDAHAKNYSLLHEAGGHVRLAPLYDVMSHLPYGHARELELAMAIGGSRRLHEIDAGHWRAAVRAFGLDETATLARIARLAERLPDGATDVARQARDAGSDHPVIARLVALLADRSKHCAQALSRE